MNDFEWSMISYYVIYFKISDNYATNREGSFSIFTIISYTQLPLITTSNNLS